MSIKTAKYGFIKPELTDVANITDMNENWDKVEEELSKITSISYGTEDLTEGVSELATGQLYFVYE